MKKLLITALTICIFFMSGCGQEKVSYRKSAAFYYPAYPGSNSYRDGIMLTELREGIQYEDNLLTLVNDYLKGPISTNLYSVVPESAHAVSVNCNRDRIMVFMNESFAKLTGIELSLAGSGLAKTLMEFTGIPKIGICVKGCLLDGQTSIIFTDDNLIFCENTMPKND